jgi:hypothetical protein
MGDTPSFTALRCPQCAGSLPATDAPFVTCPYCGTHLIRQGQSGAVGGEQMVRGVHLRAVVVRDSEGTGAEAYRLLVPSGWEFRGAVQWHIENPMVPVTASFQAYNPKGLEALELLPTLPFYVSAEARRYRGMQHRYAGNIIRPLAPASEVLQDTVLPTYRGGVQGLRIAKLEDVTEALRSGRSGTPYEEARLDSACKARVQYQLGRYAIEEELTCGIESTSFATYAWGMPVQHTYWQANYLLGARAAVGQLDRLSDLYAAMVRSIRLNWQWMGFVRQLVVQMIQGRIQHIRAIGQIGAEYARMGAQMRAENYDLYQRRGSAYDRVADLASQTIRDVNVYLDPGMGLEVELPTAYGHAWGDGQGGYVMTDDPNFNPNLYSNASWTELEQKPF